MIVRIIEKSDFYFLTMLRKQNKNTACNTKVTPIK